MTPFAAYLILGTTLAAAALAARSRGEDSDGDAACAAAIYLCAAVGAAVVVASILWALATVLGRWGVGPR